MSGKPQSGRGLLPIRLGVVVAAVLASIGIIWFVQRPNQAEAAPLSPDAAAVFQTKDHLLVNVAFVRVLGIERMAGDPFVAASAGKALFGPRGDLVIRLLVVISILSAINACALMAPRVLLAMSRDGLLHPAFETVSPVGTPTVAHWATIGVVSGFILTGTFDTVLALCAFFYVVGYLLSFLSVFALRRKEPDTPRPFRVPGFPVTTGVVVVGSAAFLIGALVLDWKNSWKSLVLLAVSAPVYWAVARTHGGTAARWRIRSRRTSRRR